MEVLGVLLGSGLIVTVARAVWRWRHRPRLRIYLDLNNTGEQLRTAVPGRARTPIRTDEGHIHMAEPEAVWYHLHVTNDGKRVATECTAKLDTIEQEGNDGWQRHLGFHNPLALPWAGTGAELVTDIHSKRTLRLDLGCVFEGERAFRLHSPTPPSGSIRELIRGHYRLTVTVYSKSAKPVSGSFALNFGGDWNDVVFSPAPND